MIAASGCKNANLSLHHIRIAPKHMLQLVSWLSRLSESRSPLRFPHQTQLQEPPGRLPGVSDCYLPSLARTSPFLSNPEALRRDPTSYKRGTTALHHNGPVERGRLLLGVVRLNACRATHTEYEVFDVSIMSNNKWPDSPRMMRFESQHLTPLTRRPERHIDKDVA